MATTPSLALLDRPDQVLAALAPLRRDVLALLDRPRSATEVGDALGLSRQRVNHHLKALEAAGLVEVVEERQRRGFVERVFRATADRFVVDPAVVGAGLDDAVAGADRRAAEHLTAVAAATVRDVTRMQAAATRRGERLLTFTIEAEVAFDQPADLEAFTQDLATAVEATAQAHHHAGGRRYRVVVGAHPAPRPSEEEPS